MKASVSEKLLIAYARHFPIRRGKMRVIDALWRPAAGAQDAQRIATLRHGGLKMQCDLREMLQRQFYFFGTYFLEDHILACWEDSAREAHIIFDIGANAGIYSLAALSAQPQATVHAFEPTPETAARLRETAKLNGLDRLYVHEAAVSQKNGYATLRRFRGETGTNEGMNYVIEDVGAAGAERVATVGLDQFCEDYAIERIDLLKIDVQGQESSVLRGADHMIRAGRIGKIFMELNWDESRGAACPAASSIHQLDEAEYYFSIPGTTLNWRKSGDWLRTLSDIVASQMNPEQAR